MFFYSIISFIVIMLLSLVSFLLFKINGNILDESEKIITWIDYLFLFINFMPLNMNLIINILHYIHKRNW